MDENEIRKKLSRSVKNSEGLDKIVNDIHNGKKLRVKLGIDVTSPNIHLGRIIPLLKLKAFQDLGCQIILIIGDFTSLIGDTSDKESERKALTKQDIKQNLKTYIKQVGQVLPMRKVKVEYNSKWLSKLTMDELFILLDLFSVNDFTSRDLIAKRLKEGNRVSMKETIYPVFQGYDSVAIKADVEIGGSDQWVNLLAGRKIQESKGMKPQHIITLELIDGLDGRKMSSSYGNSINLTDSAEDMFAKVMSVKDELVDEYFIHTTELEIDEIDKFKSLPPLEKKLKLAFEITKLLKSEPKAELAKKAFNSNIREKNMPEDIPTIKVKSLNVLDAIVEIGFADSRGDGKRLIKENSVKINSKVINSPVELNDGDLIQKGRHFAYIKKKGWLR